MNDNGYLAPLEHDAMNQDTSINTAPINYDGNFNQTTSSYGQTFVYNAQNQLVDGTMQATYDGLGRCVRRTVSGVTTLFTYDDWNPVTEWDGAGNWRGWTIYGAKADEVLLRYDAIYGPQVYKHDNQGSVTFILDGPTHVAEKCSYDVYGRPTIMDGAGNVRGQSAIGNRYMYTAREWIADLQLYDYRHRFYNPDTGRFLQTDPTGFDAGDMNLFRYCGDDPMDRSDPMGLEEEYYRARVTAYGFGRDNAYAGHPEGGDAIAHTSDRSRREILPNGDTVSHAALGDGTFDHPSSVAVHPNSGIRMGSRVYVKGVGWFKVEDVCSTRMPTDTFDMWTGRSNPRQRAQLTGSRDVTVYGPKEAVPRRKRQLGPGARWNFMPRGDSRAAYPTSAVSSGGGVGDGGGGNSQATAEGDDRSFDTSRLVTELSVGNNSGEGFHPRGPR